MGETLGSAWTGPEGLPALGSAVSLPGLQVTAAQPRDNQVVTAPDPCPLGLQSTKCIAHKGAIFQVSYP